MQTRKSFWSPQNNTRALPLWCPIFSSPSSLVWGNDLWWSVMLYVWLGLWFFIFLFHLLVDIYFHNNNRLGEYWANINGSIISWLKFSPTLKMRNTSLVVLLSKTSMGNDPLIEYFCNMLAKEFLSPFQVLCIESIIVFLSNVNL